MSRSAEHVRAIQMLTKLGVVDDLTNANPDSVPRIDAICGLQKEAVMTELVLVDSQAPYLPAPRILRNSVLPKRSNIRIYPDIARANRTLSEHSTIATG